jgi:hypothetical protein
MQRGSECTIPMIDRKRSGRLLLVAPAVLLGGFLACVLTYAVPNALLIFALLGFILVPLILLALIVVAIILAWRYWPAALALVAAVALLYVLVAVPRPPDAVAATTATWLQFLFVRPGLTRQASVHNLGDEGSLVVITVDGFVPVGSRGFVYDSSGQVNRDPAARSRAWASVAGRTVLARECAWTVKHLVGSYYSYFSSC